MPDRSGVDQTLDMQSRETFREMDAKCHNMYLSNKMIDSLFF